MELKTGSKAPDFALPNQDGEVIQLSDLAGQWLVLYFYPKDNTSGCTLEAKEFTCLVDEFQALGARIIGVSKDSLQSHRNFVTKQELGIDLLSDAEHKVMQEYGVWRWKKMYGRETEGVVRSTFLIDPAGRIARTWYNVKARGHAEKVLRELRQLR